MTRFKFLICSNGIERCDPGHSPSPSLLDYSLIILYWAFPWGILRKIVFEWDNFFTKANMLLGQVFIWTNDFKSGVHECVQVPFSLPLCAHTLLSANPVCHFRFLLAQQRILFQTEAAAGQNAHALSSEARSQLQPCPFIRCPSELEKPSLKFQVSSTSLLLSADSPPSCIGTRFNIT